ncbi:MAG: AAA family ATPase [Aliarcobacter sp.]|nr:AAA family ATPase [Aliarcobacter sp.]
MCNAVLLPKMNLIDKFIKILESNDEMINDENIFYNLEKDTNLNKKIALNISDENILNINTDFFVFYKKLISYELKPFTYELFPTLSSGQKAILFIFARINDAIQKINQENKNKNILILLDEADLKLHLEWQRKFLFDLIEFLNSYSNNKFYVLYATHSPMILSDITNDRVVFLRKIEDKKYSEDKQDFSKSTFGANIYDIYADSFFVDDFMGKFAQNKINEVIKLIESHKEDKQTISKNQVPNLLKIVKNIGEPLLRNKLEDDIKSLFEIKDDISEIADTLKDKNFEEIRQELDKYSQDKQKDILEKLFGN